MSAEALGADGPLVVESLPGGWDGDRLDRVVAQACGCPRSAAASLIDDGFVSIDGDVVTQRSFRCRQGQRLAMAAAPTSSVPDAPQPDVGVALAIVHVDEDVIVVDKPAGLVVHPGAGQPDGTLVNGLLAQFPELAEVGETNRPGIVHRLDKPTSGLLVVARHEQARQSLVGQLADHTVARCYVALVAGHLEHDAGTIDAPIGRSRNRPTTMTVAADGRRAVTHYDVLRRDDEPDTTLVRCRLETGRTHQIRVHLSALGHPVVGDDKYGRDRGVLETSRLQLHAAELGFVHPGSGEPVSFTSELAPDLHGRMQQA